MLWRRKGKWDGKKKVKGHLGSHLALSKKKCFCEPPREEKRRREEKVLSPECSGLLVPLLTAYRFILLCLTASVCGRIDVVNILAVFKNVEKTFIQSVTKYDSLVIQCSLVFNLLSQDPLKISVSVSLRALLLRAKPTLSADNAIVPN